MAGDMSILLLLCFTISGAAALALEVLWLRSAGLVLGTTAPTTATVLACYFTGLGCGAAWARRIRQRPVRLYGMLELGAGLGAIWSFVIFSTLASDTAQVWLAAMGMIGRIAGVAVAILPTTLCLGATLPAIGRALIEVGTLGRRGGLLYALNTFGGALGIVAAGFGLPALIGVGATYGVAAGASLLAGACALTIGDGRQEVCAKSEASGDIIPAAVAGRLCVVAVGTGALGLGLEVFWTRLFAQVLHNSVYSFTAIALVFLLAIAAGAALAALLLRHSTPAAVAAAALMIAGVATVGGLWIFVGWTDGLAYVGMHSGLAEYIGRIVALAALAVGPAAVASGVVLPALWAAWGDGAGADQPLGALSAANMLGGVIGAAAAGFVLVPTIGVRGGLLIAAVAYVVLADLLAALHSRLRPLAYAALLIIAVADPLRAPLVHFRPEGETLRALKEGPSGIVTVVESKGDRQLRLDNYYVLGSSAAAANQRRQGLLPLLLHRDPHRVAFVGLATGITASAAPALVVQETTVIELVPEVAAAARVHFAPWNAQLLERSDVRLVLDDGRRYLAASRESFDVIVSDLFIPWHAGAGNLYAREMFETVARRLAPEGLFCQWLPLYQLTREEFEIVVRTFLTVFPHTSLWRDDFYPNRPVVGLVGQLAPHPIDLAHIGERLLRLPDWGRDPFLASPRALVMLYAGDLASVADVFGQAPVNTDDRPLIEFLAPRLTRVTSAGDKDWFIGEALAAFYDMLDARSDGAPEPFLPSSGAVAEARRAGTALYRYALAYAEHDEAAADRFQAEVRALVPEVIHAADAMSTGQGVAEARQELQGLQAEQEQVRRRLEEMERRLKELTSSRQGLR
jgi:spermidine synthase